LAGLSVQELNEAYNQAWLGGSNIVVRNPRTCFKLHNPEGF
jgi:hypothetical protein